MLVYPASVSFIRNTEAGLPADRGLLTQTGKTRSNHTLKQTALLEAATKLWLFIFILTKKKYPKLLMSTSWHSFLDRVNFETGQSCFSSVSTILPDSPVTEMLISTLALVALLCSWTAIKSALCCLLSSVYIQIKGMWTWS